MSEKIPNARVSEFFSNISRYPYLQVLSLKYPSLGSNASCHRANDFY